MPNHVTNVITACPSVVYAMTREHTESEKAEMRKESAESAARYEARTGEVWPYIERDAQRIEARFVDFGLLIPEPESIYRGGCDMRHPHVEDGVVYQHCWSDWNREHWGTKWNGYSTKIEPLDGDLCRLEFETAWNHPIPVMEALAAKFPDETILVEWADEDFGSNLGTYRIAGGEVVDLVEPDHGTDEANELAARVKYGKSYAEVRADWDADEIDHARRAAFCARIEAERGVENGYTVIRAEGLKVPEDIITSIATVEQAEAYWSSADGGDGK
jgi:hypothetical protein